MGSILTVLYALLPKALTANDAPKKEFPHFEELPENVKKMVLMHMDNSEISRMRRTNRKTNEFVNEIAESLGSRSYMGIDVEATYQMLLNFSRSAVNGRYGSELFRVPLDDYSAVGFVRDRFSDKPTLRMLGGRMPAMASEDFEKQYPGISLRNIIIRNNTGKPQADEPLVAFIKGLTRPFMRLYCYGLSPLAVAAISANLEKFGSRRPEILVLEPYTRSLPAYIGNLRKKIETSNLTILLKTREFPRNFDDRNLLGLISGLRSYVEVGAPFGKVLAFIETLKETDEEYPLKKACFRYTYNLKDEYDRLPFNKIIWDHSWTRVSFKHRDEEKTVLTIRLIESLAKKWAVLSFYRIKGENGLTKWLTIHFVEKNDESAVLTVLAKELGIEEFQPDERTQYLATDEDGRIQFLKMALKEHRRLEPVSPGILGIVDSF